MDFQDRKQDFGFQAKRYSRGAFVFFPESPYSWNMKTTSLIVMALALALVSTGCHASTDTNAPTASQPTGPVAAATDPNTAAFQQAVPGVQSVQIIIGTTATDTLDASLVAMGGFPATADVNHAHRAVSHSFAVGYDAKGAGILVVYINDQGQTVVTTDTDAIAVYQHKAHRLVSGSPGGEEASQADHSGASGNGSSEGRSSAHIRGKTIEVGMTKDEVRHRLGRPTSVFDEGSDHETWEVRPFNAAHTLAVAGISQIASGFGLFSGAAAEAGQGFAPKRKTYMVKFDGDRVSRITTMSM
jgi:outer membrane protein assembly factor BamE (lipoprotein component of BamABCDE complex)